MYSNARKSLKGYNRKFGVVARILCLRIHKDFGCNNEMRQDKEIANEFYSHNKAYKLSQLTIDLYPKKLPTIVFDPKTNVSNNIFLYLK